MNKDLEKLFKGVWINEVTYRLSSFEKVAIHKEFIKIGWDKYSKKIFKEFLLRDYKNDFIIMRNPLDIRSKKVLGKIIHGRL
jgi:hypothetical protein